MYLFFSPDHKDNNFDFFSELAKKLAQNANYNANLDGEVIGTYNPIAAQDADSESLDCLVAVTDEAIERQKRKTEAAIRRQRDELKALGNRIILQHIIENLKSRQERIESADKLSRDTIASIVIEEVDRVAEGNLACIRYNATNEGKQSAEIYDGMCWSHIDEQRFLIFAKDAIKQCCIKNKYIDDPELGKVTRRKLAYHIVSELLPPCHSDSVWINLQNGTLEVTHDGEITFREHRRDDNFFYVLPYVYDPTAQCPMWRNFLNEVLPNTSVQNVLAEYIGYCFTWGIKTEKMLVLNGVGSNGKSVVLDVVNALLGEENVSHETLSMLTREPKSRVNIENKLANISQESQADLDMAILKLLVSGDPVTANLLYHGIITVSKYGKLITSFNVMPKAENTHGFFRRFILMVFDKVIDEKHQDKNLAKKIIAEELPGILNWVIEGLKRFLVECKFSESKELDDNLRRYKLQADSVLLFFTTSCTPTTDYTQPAQEVYDAYKKFCFAEDIKPVGRSTFYTNFDKLETGNVIVHNKKMYHVKYNEQ